jgi:uncharacterized UBP type Zn finger protein
MVLQKMHAAGGSDEANVDLQVQPNFDHVVQTFQQRQKDPNFHQLSFTTVGYGAVCQKYKICYIGNQEQKPIYYDLYGVVNHFGTMFGGHYIARCQNFKDNSWYQFDDSRVSKINPNDVVDESAYVLFYKRRK